MLHCWKKSSHYLVGILGPVNAKFVLMIQCASILAPCPFFSRICGKDGEYQAWTCKPSPWVGVLRIAREGTLGHIGMGVAESLFDREGITSGGLPWAGGHCTHRQVRELCQGRAARGHVWVRPRHSSTWENWGGLSSTSGGNTLLDLATIPPRKCRSRGKATSGWAAAPSREHGRTRSGGRICRVLVGWPLWYCSICWFV